MIKRSKLIIEALSLIFIISLFSCKNTNVGPVLLSPGMKINKNIQFEPGIYSFQGKASLEEAMITIEGNNLLLDFKNVFLNGGLPGQMPDQFKGIGILIKNSKNITIKNLSVKGYKIGLLVEGVKNFRLENSDLSYNYKQKLNSTRIKEDESDWLSHHDNENDEWFRYGAAVYMKNCDEAVVKNLTVKQVQNALLLVNCNKGKFYNNDLSFNSGLGIGLYRSSNNLIFNNRLDWNIRGFSFGVYNRGQDSAGILAYEQSSENTIACNSATHSGDGIFIWAGNQTMESGEGGCNNNLLIANDCSFASNNGIEITFSGGNKVEANKMEACDYGIWGGYSYEMTIENNWFSKNEHGIAIEHGNNNQIQNNYFLNDKDGIAIWERSIQPKSWPFAQKRNVSNRDNVFYKNILVDVQKPFVINSSINTKLERNTARNPESEIFSGSNNKKLVDQNNVVHTGNIKFERPDLDARWQSIFEELKPEPDLKPIEWNQQLPRGRENILVNEWGPYNFEYPTIWLRSASADEFRFALFGPEGNWQLIDLAGFRQVNPTRGSFPTSISAKPEADTNVFELKLRYIGPGFTDQFGVYQKKGEIYGIRFVDNLSLSKDPL